MILSSGSFQCESFVQLEATDFSGGFFFFLSYPLPVVVGVACNQQTGWKKATQGQGAVSGFF